MAPNESSGDTSVDTGVDAGDNDPSVGGNQGSFTGQDNQATSNQPQQGSGTGGQSQGVGSPPQGGQQQPGDGHLRQFLRRQFALQMENVIPEDLQSILDKIEDRLEALRQSEEVEFADKACGRIKLAGQMLKASAEGSFQLPWKSAASIVAGLTYLLNPVGFLPEILKGDDAILDDALVVYLCYTVVEQDLNRFLRSHNLDPEEFGMESIRSGF